MRIEIICTGDEVLTGKIVNTNFSYMSQKLEDVGLSVHWGTTVGDDRESLLAAFQLAAQRADAVIVNGGLGPTVDDLSQEVAAQAAGVELVLNEEWLEKMEAFFTKRSRIMPPNNRKQAMLPATAEMIDNPIGTACGFALDIGQARFFFTPGVPRELRRMLEEQARGEGARCVAFGFNADDLMASMVTWFTSGFRMGGIPSREIGGMRYVFPLYRITKKELTLYLELVAPELNRQGTPGRFTTGPDERSMSYAMTDAMLDLWPGMDYYLFHAFENMQRYMFPMVESECRACGGVYLLQEGVTNAKDICDVCDYFARRELSTVS